MSTINQLFAAMSVQGSDLIPVFTSQSQTTRRITVAQLLAFIQAQQPANQSTVSTQYATPGVNGFIVQVLQPITGGPDVHMIINPLTDYATGTIQLPPFNTAFDGQQVIITTTKSIAAVTIDLNGASAGFGLPSSLGANDSWIAAYDALSASWYMLGRSVPSPATTNTAQTLTNKTLQGAILAAAALGQPVSGDLLNCVNLPITTGVSGLAANIAAFLAGPTSARLAAALTDETGTGLAVFNNAPTFLAPRLGTPFSGDLVNCINLPISTGVSGLAAGIAAFLASPTTSPAPIAWGGTGANTASGARAALGLNGFTTADQTINASLYSFAHGFGALPSSIEAYARCVTTEAGWTAGTIISLGNQIVLSGSPASPYGVTTGADTSSLYARIATGGLTGINPGTGATFVLTPANWRVFFKAYP